MLTCPCIILGSTSPPYPVLPGEWKSTSRTRRSTRVHVVPFPRVILNILRFSWDSERTDDAVTAAPGHHVYLYIIQNCFYRHWHWSTAVGNIPLCHTHLYTYRPLIIYVYLQGYQTAVVKNSPWKMAYIAPKLVIVLYRDEMEIVWCMCGARFLFIRLYVELFMFISLNNIIIIQPFTVISPSSYKFIHTVESCKLVFDQIKLIILQQHAIKLCNRSESISSRFNYNSSWFDSLQI